jgi:hypothetical protein
MKKQLWKINCEENKFPGLWQRWFKNQCVAVGWAGKWGYIKLNGKSVKGKLEHEHGWIVARNCLNEIERGDYIVVSLSNHRVGRIGEVTGTAIGDEDWDPFVPRSKDSPDGEKGRRIFVRWDMTIGPDDRKLVVALPKGARLTQGEFRPTIAKVRSQSFDSLSKVMNEPSNWVGLSQFSYEKALSDYIGSYPHLLEDGLLPHPNKKVRELVFSDGRRADVLLEDPKHIAVIVECKQGQPTLKDIDQLKHYLKQFQRKETQKVRGILVHGGAQKLTNEVRRAVARSKPTIELVQFNIRVDFSRSL